MHLKLYRHCKMYATRYQTKMRQEALRLHKLPVQKVKTQKSDINLREEALNNRENELKKRETALIKREKELKKREAEVAKREAALSKTSDGKKASKQMTVMYTSNYSGERPECLLIGHFNNEKAAVDGVIEWLFKHNKGGFDVGDLSQLFYDRGIECDTDYDEAEFETEEEFIEYYQKKCKNFKQLREVLSNDGNSYFEDPWNGWKLRII